MKTFQLEKVSLSDMQVLGLFVDKLTADDKYSLTNRDILLQHLQTQLSHKEKNIFRIFLFILEI